MMLWGLSGSRSSKLFRGSAISGGVHDGALMYPAHGGAKSTTAVSAFESAAVFIVLQGQRAPRTSVT